MTVVAGKTLWHRNIEPGQIAGELRKTRLSPVKGRMNEAESALPHRLFAVPLGDLLE